MKLRGKTALVTGGAIRVGKAISLALARAGANVVINYHSSAPEAAQTAAEAEALGVAALPIQADVSDPAQVQQMAAQAQARFGAVDVLVNGASLFKRTPLPMADVADWRRVTSIGLDGAFYCANALAPRMLAQGEGVIINLVDQIIRPGQAAGERPGEAGRDRGPSEGCGGRAHHGDPDLHGGEEALGHVPEPLHRARCRAPCARRTTRTAGS